MSTMGKRIKAVRLERGWAQERLAERVGVSQQLIGQIETGKNRGTSHIAKIAHELGVSAYWLQTGSGPKEPVLEDGLSERERRLIERFRAATPADQDLVEGVVDRVSPLADHQG